MSDRPNPAPTAADRVQAWGAWLRKNGPTWRAFVIAVVLLALADAAARVVARWDLARDEFSPPWRSDALVREYLQQLAEYRDPLIAMVGDSTLQPLPEMPHEITVPNLMQQRLRAATGNPRWKVANLGLSGAHLADQLNIVRLLPKTAEVVIVTVNYKFLGPQAETPLTIYPGLAPIQEELNLPPEIRILTAPVWIARVGWRLLKNHWFLLRNGAWISDRLFSNRPGAWLHWQVSNGWFRQQLHWVRCTMTGAPTQPISYSRWQPPYINDMRQAVSFSELRLGSKQMLKLFALLTELRQRGFITIVYATPYDWTHLEEYFIADRRTIHGNLELLGALIEQAGAVFLDLSEMGEPGWFLDMDHLTAEGRGKLADLLISEIRKRQRMAESLGQ